MNKCMESFFEFCPSDRAWFMLVAFLLIFVGYVIGTNGHWNRFYWKKFALSKSEEVIEDD